MELKIRDDIPRHLSEIRAYHEAKFSETTEDMSGFFGRRVEGYDEHMSPHAAAYAKLPEYLPDDAMRVLDLGCGTGLEIGEIFSRRDKMKLPRPEIIGVDMTEKMLEQLRAKYPEVKTVLGDYFKIPFSRKGLCDLSGDLTATKDGSDTFDAAVSFESLHHFTASEKQPLYDKIYACLKDGGVFLLADYLACCDEEEEMCAAYAAKKRARDNIPAGSFVHIDTPLTVPHELAILKKAGFDAEAVFAHWGATIVVARK